MSEVSSQADVRRGLMTNGQSRLLDVLGVGERALEKQLAPRRKMLEMFFTPSSLARLKKMGLIPTAAELLRKKTAVKRGGRKKLASDKQRFYLVGRTVDEQFGKFDPAFKLLRTLKAADGNWDSNELRSELAKRRFTPREIDALLRARTPMGATKRFVAQSLASPKHPNGLSLQTIHSCYSRYLKVLKA